jgi:hypothetical protein
MYIKQHSAERNGIGKIMAFVCERMKGKVNPISCINLGTW